MDAELRLLIMDFIVTFDFMLNFMRSLFSLFVELIVTLSFGLLTKPR